MNAIYINRDSRRQLENMLDGIESGGHTWEFTHERLSSWQGFSDHLRNVRNIPEEAKDYFRKMIEHLNYIYIDLRTLGPEAVGNSMVISVSTTPEHKKCLRDMQTRARKIEECHKEIKLLLGEIDNELKLDTEYSKYYRVHKHRGNYK